MTFKIDHIKRGKSHLFRRQNDVEGIVGDPLSVGAPPDQAITQIVTSTVTEVRSRVTDLAETQTEQALEQSSVQTNTVVSTEQNSEITTTDPTVIGETTVSTTTTPNEVITTSTTTSVPVTTESTSSSTSTSSVSVTTGRLVTTSSDLTGTSTGLSDSSDSILSGNSNRSSSTKASSSAVSDSGEGSSGSSAGIAIGITVAILAVIGIILAFFMVRRSRKQRAEARKTQIMSGLGPDGMTGPFSPNEKPYINNNWSEPTELSPVSSPAGMYGYSVDRFSPSPVQMGGPIPLGMPPVVPVPVPPMAYQGYGPTVDEQYNNYDQNQDLNGLGVGIVGTNGFVQQQNQSHQIGNSNADAYVYGGTEQLPIGMAVSGEEPGELHKVVGMFQPSQDDELFFKVGDQVKVLVKYDDGWALGICVPTGQKGVFPLECTIPTGDTSSVNSTETGAVPKSLIPGGLGAPNPVVLDSVKMKRTSSMIGGHPNVN